MSIDRTGCIARRHGDSNAYGHGCRCPDAREDRRVSAKRRREGRLPPGMVPAIGGIRRLQALAAIGWSSTELAGPLGTSSTNVLQFRRGRTLTMTRQVHERIAAVYEQLSGTPGSSNRVRDHARRSGWAPPLLWEDDTIDDPAAGPVVDEPVPVRALIDLAEVEFLSSFGMQLDEIAARLNVQADSIRLVQNRAQRRSEVAA